MSQHNPDQDDVFNQVVALFKAHPSIKYTAGILSVDEAFELTQEIIDLLSYLRTKKSHFQSFELEINYGDTTKLALKNELTHLKIQLSTDGSDSIVFCSTVEDLISTYGSGLIKGGSLPAYFYLFDTDYQSNGNISCASLEKLNSVLDWLKLLEDIADIEKQTEQGLMLYFLIKSEKDKYTKPLEFEVSNLVGLIDIPTIPMIGDFSSLMSQVKKDLNNEEKRAFFKLSLVDVLKQLKKNEPNKSYIHLAFENIEKIRCTYYENYEVFVHNFALGEFHKEVEAKYFEYVEKIQAVLSDIQTKIYAIPAVLIGMGALSKIDNIIGHVFIFLGILVTSFVTHLALNDQSERLSQTKESMNFVFDKLKTKGSEKLETNEVLSEISTMKNKLQNLITTRGKRIGYYRVLCWMIPPVAFVLLIIKNVVKYLIS